jgi:hypothetical protein
LVVNLASDTGFFIQEKYPYQVNLPKVAPGYYFIQATSEEGMGIKSFIIK